MTLFTCLNRIICRWALLGVALGGPLAAQAQFTYMAQGGAITITGYTGPGGDVTIPDAIHGLPVTGIGNSAFNSLSNLTSVTISDRVTGIGDWAFYSCLNLTNVVIGNRVTTVGV